MEQVTPNPEVIRGRGRVIDRAGQRYGRLVAIRQVEPKIVCGKSRVHWLCRCDCGNEVVVWAWSLGRGATKSCGCLSKDYKIGAGRYARNQVVKEYKRNARIRSLVWELSDDDFDRLVSQACFYCGHEPSMVRVKGNSEFTYSGIDRKDNTLGYTPENTLPCCAICNYAKRAMSFDDFMAWVGRLTAHQMFSPGKLPTRLLKGAV